MAAGEDAVEVEARRRGELVDEAGCAEEVRAEAAVERVVVEYARAREQEGGAEVEEAAAAEALVARRGVVAEGAGVEVQRGTAVRWTWIAIVVDGAALLRSVAPEGGGVDAEDAAVVDAGALCNSRRAARRVIR